ncbi:MAG: DUF374 domain-containing protein [Candidatus Desantisbacteria bacterium]
MKLHKLPFVKNILPQVASLFIRGISRTTHLAIEGEEEIDRLRLNKERLLYVFWHGRQFLLVWYIQRKNPISLLSSLSSDGEIQAQILAKFGYNIVRGSSAKGGASGLLGLKERVFLGDDVGLAADGPKGPAYFVKDGIIFLAKKLNMWIVPLTSSSHPCWTMKKAWDEYLLPTPGAKAIIKFGKPYKPEGEIEEEAKILKEKLDTLTKEADLR